MNESLSEADRASLLVDFALQARAMNAQLDEYADALAGEDAALRAELSVAKGWLW
ncbi:hypothetical protein [Curtobacterium sp. MCBD17_019]|uniref:hypothetical protein n=1 Tax=Curtobacterium sp. MCBD17_019 TaxID=2175669 RepID=UPI0015E8A8E1|nr:hypothetical protein [Curtobacterium sp. MCBD17_019]